MNERAGLFKSNSSQDKTANNRAHREPTLTGQDDRQEAQDVVFNRQQPTRTQLVDSLSRMDKTLQARRLLHLQQTHGNRFVRRIIADLRTQSSTDGDAAEAEAQGATVVVRQGRRVQPTGSESPPVARQPDNSPQPDPSHLIEDLFPETPGEKEANKFAKLTLSVVKDPILEALRRNDAVTFLNKLRAVELTDRLLLEDDQGFLDEIRHSLHGLSLWVVRLILRFGDHRPANVQQLHTAASDRNLQLIKDLVRTDEKLRSETETPGVREMLNYELRGLPAHDEVLRLLDEPETQTRQTNIGTNPPPQEVHYEVKEGIAGAAGQSELKTFTGGTTYELARTSHELRVIVRIRLVTKSGAPYDLSDQKATQWRSGIEKVWNNLFYAWNGTTQLTIVFVPLFTDQSYHFIVTVLPGSGRADKTDWYEDSDGTTIAHEFGHMLGNPDEYRLPGTIAEAQSAGLSEEDAMRSSVEGITGKAGESDTTLPGIMGRESETDTALPRHVWPVLDWYNKNMKPATEQDFKLQ